MPAPLGTKFFDRILEPGDLLLYSGKGFWSWLIKVKTWCDISHAELYLGDMKSAASRDGIGVDIYPTRLDDLYLVLRPKGVWDRTRALHWFLTGDNPTGQPIKGQGYDWWGLMRFLRVGKPSLTRQFCFELVVRLLRAGGIEPFAPDFDADRAAGSHFEASSAFTRWWARGKK